MLVLFCDTMSEDNQRRILATFKEPAFLRHAVLHGARPSPAGGGETGGAILGQKRKDVTVAEGEGTILYHGVYDEGFKQFIVKRQPAPEYA